MVLLVQLQEGNHFQGKAADNAMINGGTGNSFSVWNLTCGQLCVLPLAKKKKIKGMISPLEKSGSFSSKVSG